MTTSAENTGTIQLVPDTDGKLPTGPSGRKLWDPKLTYGDVAVTPRGVVTVGTDARALIKQYFEDDRLIRRITLPCEVRIDSRSHTEDMRMRVSEIRATSKRNPPPFTNGCNNLVMIGDRHGNRVRAERVYATYAHNNDPRRTGRRVFAKLQVQEGDLIQVAEQKSVHRSFHLVYRVAGFVPIPADHPILKTAEGSVTQKLLAMNLTLVAVYDLNTLTGVTRYIDPKMEAKEDAVQSIRDFIDEGAAALRRRVVRSYHEFLMDTAASNNRYDFFGEGNDVMQTVPVAPEHFLKTIREKVAAVQKERVEARTEGQPSVSRHVPCSIQYRVNDADTDNVSVEVALTFPSLNGVKTIVTTHITDIPGNWYQEPTLYRRAKTFEDLVKKIEKKNGTAPHKLLFST